MSVKCRWIVYEISLNYVLHAGKMSIAMNVDKMSFKCRLLCRCNVDTVSTPRTLSYEVQQEFDLSLTVLSSHVTTYVWLDIEV